MLKIINEKITFGLEKSSVEIYTKIYQTHSGFELEVTHNIFHFV
jgi:hypothetical protein